MGIQRNYAEMIQVPIVEVAERLHGLAELYGEGSMIT